MRPTLFRLIAGGALGIAFSIALTLPGSVVFPDDPPIRQLAAPAKPTATVLHATPVVRRPTKAPARPRVVVRRVYVPTAGTAPATSVVRRTPPRSKPARKHVEPPPAPVEQPVTPLAARPAAPLTEPEEEREANEPSEADEPMKAEKPKTEKPKKADKPRKAEKPKKADEPRKSEKPKKAEKPRKAEKPKKAKQPKDPGSGKKDKPDESGKKDRADRGSGRGDDSFRS